MSEPEQPETETSPKPKRREKDPLLATIVEAAGEMTHAAMAITVWAGGTMFSGILTSPASYYDRLAKLWSDRAGPDNGFTFLFSKQAAEAKAAREKEEVRFVDAGVLHMVDVILVAGDRSKRTELATRISLDSVDAWSVGAVTLDPA